MSTRQSFDSLYAHVFYWLLVLFRNYSIVMTDICWDKKELH